jgi:integrase
VSATNMRIVAFRGKYAAEFTENGKRRRRSLGTDDPSEVESKLLDLGAEIEARSRPAVVSVEFAWQGKRESLGARPSVVSMDAIWRNVGPFFGSRPADMISEELCLAYIERRRASGVSDGTIRLELSKLRASLKWAEKKDLIGKAPFIWMPPASDPRDVRLTREQAACFIAACEAPHLRLFVVLALTTGARKEALLDLTWDRVDFDAQRINLKDPTRPKTAKGRAMVPMNATALNALREAHLKAATPYVIEYAGRPVKFIKMGLRRAGQRCGMEFVSAHVFRHAAATWMAEGGISMAEIAQFLGHKDSRVTERVYARFSPTYLRGAASMLEL